MTKLLGAKPNQAPTNADLGDLAYQDGANCQIGPITIVDGEVGIGNPVPNQKLHVEGNIAVGSSTTSAIASVAIRSGTSDTTAVTRYTTGLAELRSVGGALQIVVQDSSALVLSTNDTERVRVSSTGNVGIAAASPTHALDVNSDSIRVRTAKTPASASDTGTQGQIAWDANYIYICTATDTWKRVAIATW